jgi:hypothetical protein
MAIADYHSHPYVRQINEWHLELAMLRDLVDHIFTEIDGPDWMTSSAHICKERLAHLVETFPFPPPDLAT